MYKSNKRSIWKHIDFMILDIVVLQIAYCIAFMIRHDGHLPYGRGIYESMAAIICAVHIVVAIIMESYHGIVHRGYFKEFTATWRHMTIVTVILLSYMFLMKNSGEYSRSVFLMMWGIATILSYLARLLLKYILRKNLKRRDDYRQVMLVTSSDKVNEITTRIKKDEYRDYRITSIVLVDRNAVGEKYENVSVVADTNGAIEYIKQNVVDEVFVNVGANLPLPKELIEACSLMGITVHLNLMQLSELGGDKTVEKFGEYTVMTSSLRIATERQVIFKRGMDIVGSIIGLIFTGIAFLFVAPIIYMKSPGPIFFSQIRVGQNGRRFKLYKFRSMYLDAEERKKELMEQNEMNGLMFKMKDDPRVIKGIGNFIRKYSIDELPQFWNVLKGEMSLVGNCYIIGTTKKNPVFSSVCPNG
ncbi:MAG: sugar transferase [Clostridia bacterium]|nr:sugar transferase [Clostridia bacterium]